ncbi:MAG TPA: chromosome segregation protein ScpA, partial [Ginsengibacter sp.]
FKLMKAFERVASRLHEKRHQPVHTVVQYDYTMEGSRKYMLDLVKKEHTISFEKIFDVSENRIHAIFLFLNMLELVQQKYFFIIMGEGINNFIIEYNNEREEDTEIVEQAIIDPLQN